MLHFDPHKIDRAIETLFSLLALALLALLLILLLSGCASTVPPPVVVKVPVMIPCVHLPLPQRPAGAQLHFGAGSTARPYPGFSDALRSAETDWSALEIYADELEAALAGCLTIPPQEASK
jgi:hypothetical protein